MLVAPLVGATSTGRGRGTRQPPALEVRVVDAATARPLANAQVVAVRGDVADGAPRLTDADGRVRLVGAPATAVRVRQIGYGPVELALDAGARDGVTVLLERVALVLPAARAVGQSACADVGDPADRARAADLYTRLRQAAEQYEAFRRSYPFEAHVESRIAAIPGEGLRPRVRVTAERYRSDRWQPAYRPGEVVRADGPSFRADILFVSTLADDRFWQHHCFAVAGTDTVAGRAAVRLSFAPTPRGRGPDWSGAAFLDPATSALLRIEFRLERPDRVSPRRLEGYTTFATPSPFVAVPESTVAAWWHRRPADGAGWGDPDAVQLVHVQRLEYRRARPPAPSAAPAAAPEARAPQASQPATP